MLSNKNSPRGLILRPRGWDSRFISLFNRRETSFQRWTKYLELSLILRKSFSLEGQTQRAKSSSQLACLVLNKTPAGTIIRFNIAFTLWWTWVLTFFYVIWNNMTDSDGVIGKGRKPWAPVVWIKIYFNFSYLKIKLCICFNGAVC